MNIEGKTGSIEDESLYSLISDLPANSPDPEAIKQAYCLFTDDLSKKNFRNRFLYDLTGNVEHAFELTKDVIEVARKNGVDYSIQLKLIEFALRIFKDYADNKTKARIIIFGTGLPCLDILSFFSYCGIARYAEIVCTDNNFTLWGMKIIDFDVTKIYADFWGASGFEYKIVPPSELRSFLSNANTFIITATSLRNSEKSIINQLKVLSFPEDRLLNVFGRLEFWLMSEKQYFDEDIVPKLSADDVYIDGGAFDLCSSIDALAEMDGKGKVIAFEPDSISYERSHKRLLTEKYKGIVLVNTGLWSETTTLSFTNSGNLGSRIDIHAPEKINVVSLDDYLCGKKCSFIKMDIEGAELEALKGARKTITKYKPRLGICLYHKPFDAINIPLYIASLRDDYLFFIRHYHFAHFETVLYAV